MSSEWGKVSSRKIYLTREGSQFRLSFSYDANIVEKVKMLPFAKFDGESKSWSSQVCSQSVEDLRKLFNEGLTDISVDDLIEEGEILYDAKSAIVRPGSLRRPYLVHSAKRDESLFAKLRSIPGAQWEKASGCMSYPPTASVALAEMVTRGIIDDPLKLLTPADVVVSFDGRNGKFVVRAEDPRASEAFNVHFPARDVVSRWKDKGVDVEFSDDFSEEVYRGEMARAGDGLQPDGLAIDLFEYQRKNVAVAVERSGLGVFDSPGLGKTATAIAACYEVMVNRGAVQRSVIVVPGSVRTQWASEIRRFTGCEDIVIIEGDLKKRNALYKEAESARWLIVHYDVLHTDSKSLSPLIAGSYLVADECHRVKSPTAKRTKALRHLALKADRRLALTGTPVENEPGEWYSVLSGFAVPGALGNVMDFFNRYQYPGRFGGFEGARNLGELRERSRCHYVRHTKAEVAPFLPPLIVQHQPIDPDAAYAAALRRAHREARDEIKRARLEKAAGEMGAAEGVDWSEIESGAELTAVGMLRLMCSSPRLVVDSNSPSAQALCESGLVPDIDGPKLDEFRLLANDLQAVGERVVVFTFSEKMANLIADRLREDGVRYVLYTGAISRKIRDEAVLAFTSLGSEDNLAPTVFVSTDAGAEGLNLGKFCSTLVNLDVPWTSSRLEQRSNRIHRIDGTASGYRVINMTLRGTLEEGILKMVENKADLQDAIFGETGGRKKTTGRSGRSIFEDAINSWE